MDMDLRPGHRCSLVVITGLRSADAVQRIANIRVVSVAEHLH